MNTYKAGSISRTCAGLRGLKGASPRGPTDSRKEGRQQQQRQQRILPASGGRGSSLQRSSSHSSSGSRGSSLRPKAATIESWEEHRNRCTRRQCPRCRFMRHRRTWLSELTYTDTAGKAVTWLEEVSTPSHAWGLGCKICRLAGGDSKLARGVQRSLVGTPLVRCLGSSSTTPSSRTVQALPHHHATTSPRAQ